MHAAEFLVKYVVWIVPTPLLRLACRFLLWLEGRRMRRGDPVVRQIECDRHLRPQQPVITAAEEANEQHYGNDPRFFVAHLGPRLKYSACVWSAATTTLADAESATIRIYQAQSSKLKPRPASLHRAQSDQVFCCQHLCFTSTEARGASVAAGGLAGAGARVRLGLTDAR